MILTIEAEFPLEPEPIKADVDFSIVFDVHCINPDIILERVTPFGIVPSISDDDLMILAAKWLDNGGYDACCRLAEVKNCGGFKP